MMYYVQNDQEKAYPLLDEMYRLTEEEEEQQTIREETLDRMDTLAVALRMPMMDQSRKNLRISVIFWWRRVRIF